IPRTDRASGARFRVIPVPCEESDRDGLTGREGGTLAGPGGQWPAHHDGPFSVVPCALGGDCLLIGGEWLDLAEPAGDRLLSPALLAVPPPEIDWLASVSHQEIGSLHPIGDGGGKLHGERIRECLNLGGTSFMGLDGAKHELLPLVPARVVTHGGVGPA